MSTWQSGGEERGALQPKELFQPAGTFPWAGEMHLCLFVCESSPSIQEFVKYFLGRRGNPLYLSMRNGCVSLKFGSRPKSAMSFIRFHLLGAEKRELGKCTEWRRDS